MCEILSGDVRAFSFQTMVIKITDVFSRKFYFIFQIIVINGIFVKESSDNHIM